MICPPSKASSMRMDSSGRGHHLREDAVDGVGMDERDLEAEQPRTRGLVDQLGAGLRETGERGTDVVDLVRDVVYAGPAAREEPADRGVGARRRDELDPVFPDEDRQCVDALVGHGRAALERCAEEPLVRGERLVEIGHGDPDMVDAADGHAADATSAGRGARGSRTRSTRPYSTASSGVMNLSRSMSSITCPNARPVCLDRTSAICRVEASISRAAIAMSDGAPRAPAEPWWIISFACGRASRLPGAPPATITAAADIPIPKQIVLTSHFTCCIAS